MSTLTLRPNSDSYRGLIRSGGANNYVLVDEVTLDEADYVWCDGGSSGQTLYDEYGYPNHSTETETINSVTVKAYCKKVITGTDANNVTVRPLVNIGGTQYHGAAQNLTASTALYTKSWTVNPATSSAWSWTNIDDLIAGLELTSHYTDKNNNVDSHCYQLWVEVDYGASSVTVNGTKQSLTLSAKTATINAAKNIAATCDALSLTEYDATVTINSSVNVAADTSALTLTENAADVNLNVSVGAGTDSLTLTGNAADVNLNVGVSAGTDALTLTEYAANVNAAVNVNASCAELTLTENSVTVGITGDVEVSAGVDSLTMTAYPANVNAAVNISSQLQALVLTKYAANVNAGIVVDCETATMTLSEYAATITATKAVVPINQGVVYLENLGGGLYYIKQVGG